MININTRTLLPTRANSGISTGSENPAPLEEVTKRPNGSYGFPNPIFALAAIGAGAWAGAKLFGVFHNMGAALGSRADLASWQGARLLGALIGGGAGLVSSMIIDSAMADAHVERTHGTSTIEHARRMIYAFDANGDKVINMHNQSGINELDERVVLQSAGTTTDYKPTYADLNLNWRLSLQDWENRHAQLETTSASDIWEAADTNPSDGVVTDVELATLMSKFDKDKNGALNMKELYEFHEAHPLLTKVQVKPKH